MAYDKKLLLKLSNKLKELIRKEAKKDNRSMNGWIRNLIDKYFESKGIK